MSSVVSQHKKPVNRLGRCDHGVGSELSGGHLALVRAVLQQKGGDEVDQQ
jgi:hypothetical protein